MIISTLNEDSLQKIALETGGSYVRSISGDMDLEKIYESITKTVEDKDLKSGKRQHFEERFQWPLLFAIFLLLFESIYRERKREKRRWSFLFLLLLFVTTNSYAAVFSFKKGPATLYEEGKYQEALTGFLDQQIEQPNNYDLKYNLANTYYKMNQLEDAQKLYEQTAIYGEKELAQKSYYNLGNVANKQGKLKEAIEFYQKALELDPEDQDAKYNLEKTREELKKRIEEMKNRKEQQQQQNEQQDQQQNKQEEKKEEEQKKGGQKDKDEQNDQEEKKDSVQQAEGTTAEGSAGEKEGEVSKEEAVRILSNLQEERGKYLKEKIKGSGTYQVEKDW